MDMKGIIDRKKRGEELSREEIREFVDGFTAGEIPDYQASALLMAICFQGLSREETYELTEAMRSSGDVMDLSAIEGIKVDKHSTGGVGDKTTLICGPLTAAAGVPVAKMSGRGLGFTGGTIDKLESIPGFQTSIEEDRFFQLVQKNGIAVAGQTASIAPADKKLYALRDVTATVDQISLITSSVMSKKLASGSDAIVLDVKCGAGAFMKDPDQARELAGLMVELGNQAGKNTMAVITDMNQPLGRAVGNSLEVAEAIQVLRAEGPPDITELSLILAGMMIFAGGRADSPEEGKDLAVSLLKEGKGLKRLEAMIRGQGGDPRVAEDPSVLPQAAYWKDLPAEEEGFVTSLAADQVGLASQHTGAGRATKEDVPDLSAGILLHRKVGDEVHKGETLATLYGSDREKLERAERELARAYAIGPTPPKPGTVLFDTIINRN